ncbi:MAG: ABC transporter permease subunit, partial [Azospirillaceae bacterium]
GAGPARRGARWLAAVPAATLALFLAPVLVGLIGTLAPAFGVLPVLGGTALSLEPWRALAAEPALPGAVRLTLVTGLGATVVALAGAIAIVAAWHDRAAFRALRRMLAPLIALPHAALAIGLAFALAPSGLIARAFSPWATGWERPPDLLIVGDPAGLSLILGLAIKELPFLLLMIVAASGQIDTGPALRMARAAGYGPATAWVKTVLPRLYPQIRLPVYAVLAYSLSVVDMAMILGPGTPPPLAPLILRWFADPDLAMRFTAAAGACLQLALVIGAIGLWRLAEVAIARLARPWLEAGGRRALEGPARAIAVVSAGGMAAGAGAAIAAVGLWSVAAVWRWPDALPAAWTLETWIDGTRALTGPAATTLVVGLAATALALALVLGCLEYEQRAGVRPTTRALWLLYTPLLVPQIGFLFGVQVLLLVVGLDGTMAALVWAHLLFVLPYVFLTLADPWRALDPRYARTAACLGASPARVFWKVKLGLLLRPIAVAAAVGFAVSVAQYLPTVFAGAGRLPTLTTEAVGLAAGADRRLVGVFAFAQAGLPMLAFALALALPRLLRPGRRGPGGGEGAR